ncbi:MAG TPA: FHA domain-containing protein [Roseiflexaceae bacterium]|nr:FHA domain-containing protein [Roseiflexaceae bacterium]
MITSAALLIQQPDGSTREVPLQAERVVLGRAPECDIVVEGRLISRQHAAISRSGSTYTLEDLGSHNGTAVNGRRISGPSTLRAGDRIELGGVGRLTFVDGDATSTRPQAPAIGIWLDHAAQDVWVDGQRLSPQLSPAQFNLVTALAERADQVCSRAEIVAMVWPHVADGVSDEAIDALIKRVRARLSEAPGGQRYLTTLRGRGLMLHSPATAPQE